MSRIGVCMALEWHRRSGKSVRDGICRSLARKGLDMFDMAGVSVVAGYNYSSRHVIEGVVCNQVAESLGASKYEEICNQPTVLRNIHYCQSGLSFVDGDQNAHCKDATAKPSIINHDYLVLELSYGSTNTSSTLFIRAEKTGHPPEEAGIRVTVLDEHFYSDSSNCLFSIRCLGRDIGRLRQIEAILVDFNPHYSLRDHNCWQYTRRMARRLLWECQQSVGLMSDEELRLLQMEEENVERRIASIHLKRVVQKSKQGLQSLWKAWANAT